MFRKTLLALAVGAALAVSMPAVYAQSATSDTGSTRVDHRTTGQTQDTSPSYTPSTTPYNNAGGTRSDYRGSQQTPGAQSGATASTDTHGDWRSSHQAQAGDTGARNFGQDNRDLRGDRRDIAHDRTDVRHDNRDIRNDRRDIRGDNRDIRNDRREMHADRGDGRDFRNDRRDLRNDRADRRNDYRDMHADRGERRGDFRDMRNDRREMHADRGEHRGEFRDHQNFGNRQNGGDRWNRQANSGGTGNSQHTYQGSQNRGGFGGGAQQPATPRSYPTMQANRGTQASHYAMASRPAGGGGSFGGHGGRR